MDELFTDAWFESLATRLADISTAEAVTIGVAVHRGDGGTIEYGVSLGPHGTQVRRDVLPPAVLTLVLDEEAARALAGDETNAQELLASGRLKLRGDVGALGDHADAFATLRLDAPARDGPGT